MVSYILPLIAKMIVETPMASNKVLRQVLEPFSRAYCFTDAIIQKARTDVCGAYGHMYEDCFILEKSEEIEHAGIHVVPIEDIVMNDDDWADGCELPL